MMKKILLALMLCGQIIQLNGVHLPDLKNHAATAAYLEASFNPYDEHFQGNIELRDDLRIASVGWKSGSNFAYCVVAAVIRNDVKGLRETLQWHKQACGLLGIEGEDYNKHFVEGGLNATFFAGFKTLHEAICPPNMRDLPSSASERTYASLPQLTERKKAAIQTEKLAMTELLLEYGARADGSFTYNEKERAWYVEKSPLLEAAECGNVAIFRALLNKTTNIHARNRDGKAACDIVSECIRRSYGGKQGCYREIAAMIEKYIAEHPGQGAAPTASAV